MRKKSGFFRAFPCHSSIILYPDLLRLKKGWFELCQSSRDRIGMTKVFFHLGWSEKG